MIHKVHFRFMYVVVTVLCVWYCDQNKHSIRLCQNLVWIKMHKIFIKKVLWCLCLNYNQKCSGGLEGSTQFNWSWLGWVIKVWRVRFENKKNNNYRGSPTSTVSTSMNSTSTIFNAIGIKFVWNMMVVLFDLGFGPFGHHAYLLFA